MHTCAGGPWHTSRILARSSSSCGESDGAREPPHGTELTLLTTVLMVGTLDDAGCGAFLCRNLWTRNFARNCCRRLALSVNCDVRNACTAMRRRQRQSLQAGRKGTLRQTHTGFKHEAEWWAGGQNMVHLWPRTAQPR